MYVVEADEFLLPALDPAAVDAKLKLLVSKAGCCFYHQGDSDSYGPMCFVEKARHVEDGNDMAIVKASLRHGKDGEDGEDREDSDSECDSDCKLHEREVEPT